MRSAGRGGRRTGSRPGLIDRLGTLPGWAGLCAIAGSALLGAIATVVATREPGTLIGVLLVAGTFAGTIVVRPRTVYHLIPAPPLAYVVAAVPAGYIHDKSVDTNKASLLAHAGTWVASGFMAMSIAIIVAIVMTGARLFFDYRANGSRPATRRDWEQDPGADWDAAEPDPYRTPPTADMAGADPYSAHGSGAYPTQALPPASRTGGYPVRDTGPYSAPHGSGGYPADPYPASGYPAGSYSADGYPADGYQSGGYPGGSYPADSYPGGSYPADSYPGGSYPGDSYPGGSYPGDSYPGGSYPAGSYPAGSYPGDSYPAGSYPGDSYPGGSYPADRYPARDSGGYPAARDSGPYPAPHGSGDYPARDSGYPARDGGPYPGGGYPARDPGPHPARHSSSGAGGYPARDTGPYPRQDSRPRLAIGPGPSSAPARDERTDPYPPRGPGGYPVRDHDSDPYPPRQPEPY